MKGALTFVPVPADDQRRQAPAPMQELSWWQQWKSWLHYHYTQLRWDIERGLARRLHRRWGD